MNKISFVKYFTGVIISAVMATSVVADPSTGFQFVAGVNQDTLETDIPFTDTETGLGYQVGGMWNFALDRKLTLSTGALYRTNVVKMTTLGVNMDATTSFIEVPLNFNYYIIDIIKLHAGGYYAFPVGEYELKSGDDVVSSQETGADYGVSAGVGLVINRFSLDLTYKMGMADIAKDDSIENKLNTVSLSVGFLF